MVECHFAFASALGHDVSMTSAVPPATLVRRTLTEGVATLTLQSVANRNALSLAMIETLQGEIDRLRTDRDARVVVLAADGPAFSAGHDLKELLAHQNDADKGEAFYSEEMTRCSTLMEAIIALRKPVIAAVEGVATAAGCQLVATCDLAIAGDKARFALPGVATGLFCSTPLVAVARAIPRKRAMEMALTGDLYSAADAERFGLVNRVVPAGQAVAEAQKLAAAISRRSMATLALGKRTFYQQIEKPLATAYALAGQAMVDNLAFPDAAEGIAAFVEKRAPKWEDK